MSNDELLELAAKAEGSVVIENGELWIERGNKWRYWMPLDDDGDALRLAVKVGMLIDANTGMTDVITDQSGQLQEVWGDNPNAATRRAIVRAAAEIGKAMP